MTRQEQIQNIVNAVIDFQSEFQSETRRFSDNEIEKLLGSIMVGYNLEYNCITVNYCSGSCGVDLPYSNMTPDLPLHDRVIFASRKEIEKCVQEAFELYDAGEWEENDD